MSEAFNGFSSDGLELLTQLGSEDKAWFDEHRPEYQNEVAQPAKDFVVALTEALHGEISEGIVGQPKVNGSISPINNDLRFNPDASPYKDHLMFRFWEGPDKKTAPMLMIRMGESDTGFATAMGFPSVDRWREAVAGSEGEELEAALKGLAKGRKLDVVGAELKKVPKPYDPDHPRADLLRHKGLQARWSEPTPKSVSSPKFVDWCAKRLGACADVHNWLVANLS
ncbi:MAG: DUF2461 family protein [Microthrixaceae bacterium]